MRYFFYVIAVLFAATPLVSKAQGWEEQNVFVSEAPKRVLRVISSTDTSFFAPIIESFLTENPDTSVEYLVTSTALLNAEFRQNADAYDVVISSAMDLQLKLTNDGFAQKVTGLSQPEWAEWRQSLFAFTTEPAAIVINRKAFEGRRVPQTRQDLILALRARPDIFRGRIGTYDVRSSGLGYLFATQDARISETYWRLMEVMGGLETKLYCCSVDMIDDLADGTIAVAYNVLGGYADARPETSDALQIILPSDFPTTMMRTMFVSRTTKHPEQARDFLRHVIALQSGTVDRDVFPLPPLISEQDEIRQSTIGLGPALLTYLDVLKRDTFIKEWVSAIIQE
ncbi:ABC transporter substrate-binding protein [Pacificibacter sp. AS14]|uniref:ABC transporter substrate-binding protein n=1 Tax=Pacificibacter sp. AS14 TaxID=3135785 RepID=UPI00317D4DA3